MLWEICEIPLSAMTTVNQHRKIYSAQDLLEGGSTRRKIYSKKDQSHSVVEGG